MKRTVRAALGVLVAIAVAWLWFSFRASAPLESETDVLQAAQRRADDPLMRASHVRNPHRGSLADAEAAFGVVHQQTQPLRRLPEAVQQLAREVVDGIQPPERLPQPWRQAVDGLGTYLDLILISTRGQYGRLPRGLGFFDALRPEPPVDGLDTQIVAKLVALRVQQRLARGEVAVALLSCADTLAMARDIAEPHVLGQMLAAGMMLRTGGFCRDAIDRAEEPQLEDFLWSLARIQESWPSWRLTLEHEALFEQLASFGEVLSANTRSQLPPPAQQLVNDGKTAFASLGELRRLLFGNLLRRAAARAIDFVIANSGDDVAQQDAAIESWRAQSWAEKVLLPEAAPASVRLGLARRIRATQTQLTLLRARAAARRFGLQQRRWPTSWSDLPSDGFEWKDSRTGAALELRPRGGLLQIVAPADPQREAPEMVEEVRPPA